MGIQRLFFFFLLLFTALPAFADRFSFSYTFDSGNSVFGTVEGDLQADRNTVTNLHELTATYSASPHISLRFTPPINLPIVSFVLNGVGRPPLAALAVRCPPRRGPTSRA